MVSRGNGVCCRVFDFFREEYDVGRLEVLFLVGLLELLGGVSDYSLADFSGYYEGEVDVRVGWLFGLNREFIGGKYGWGMLFL